MQHHATLVKSALCRTTAKYRPNPSLFFYPGLTSAPWHDASQFPWYETLKKNHSIIKDEYVAMRKTEAKSDYVTKSNEHTLHQGEWDWFSYIAKGKRQAQFAASCPNTVALMESVDGFMTGLPFAFCFFSALKPNSRINAHYAPCNLRLRCHFPLLVPEGEDCAIRVGDEVKGWEEGEPLLFDDSFEHEVWYQNSAAEDKSVTGEDRVVLLFDIWHPDLTIDERKAVTDMFASVAKQ
jgi:aspartate beta-hydroxylase